MAEGTTEVESFKCSLCGVIFEALPKRIKQVGRRCIHCVRKRESDWRKKRKESGNPVISTKMPREYHRKYEASYFENDDNRIRRNGMAKKYREDLNLKARHEARWKVNRAIASGRLIRMPCECCGEQKTQGHHDDYNKPLEVRWLCVRCHNKWHASNTPIYPSAKARSQS